MPRNHNFNSTKAALTGRSGRGKSTLQRQLIRAHPAKWKIVYDHKGEFELLLPAFAVDTHEGFHAALKQTHCACFNPRKLIREIQIEIAADPKRRNEDARKTAFEVFCKMAFSFCQRVSGSKLFAFDECGRLVTRTGAYATHPLNEIMETGREFEIDVLIAAQRPTHLCPDLRGQISNWVLFQMPLGWIAPLVADYEEENFSDCARLAKGQFITYDAEQSEFGTGETTPDK